MTCLPKCHQGVNFEFLPCLTHKITRLSNIDTRVPTIYHTWNRKMTREKLFFISDVFWVPFRWTHIMTLALRYQDFKPDSNVFNRKLRTETQQSSNTEAHYGWVMLSETVAACPGDSNLWYIQPTETKVLPPSEQKSNRIKSSNCNT